MIATSLHVALTLALAAATEGLSPNLLLYGFCFLVVGWALFEAHRVYEGQQDIICDLMDEIRALKDPQDQAER